MLSAYCGDDARYQNDGVLGGESLGGDLLSDGELEAVGVEFPGFGYAGPHFSPLGFEAREVYLELDLGHLWKSEVVLIKEEGEVGLKIGEVGGLDEDEAEQHAHCDGVSDGTPSWHAENALMTPRGKRNRRDANQWRPDFVAVRWKCC